METKNKIAIGIDVAKDTLEICIFDGLQYKHTSIDYTQRSISKELIDSFAKSKSSAIFIMEATGVYHLKLAHLLYDAGYKVAVINPLIIKRYAQMSMMRVKTDKSDCTIIARYGYKEDLNLFKPSAKEVTQIGNTLKAIEDFLHQKSILESQRHALIHQGESTKEIVAIYNKHIKFIVKEIGLLKKRMEQLLKQHFFKEYALLTSIKGVGLMTTAMIVSVFDSFKNFESAKRAASFAGIAPAPHESGTSIKRRSSISKQGSPLARKLLYMATLSGMQFNETLKTYYTQLIERGKSKKVAMIAVAHKLLRIAFGVLKNNQSFMYNYTDKKVYM